MIMTDKVKYRDLGKLRKNMELSSGFGMLLIAVGLVVPMFYYMNPAVMEAFKWVFSAGAVIYIIARCVNISDPSDSARMKRLRRLEFWAGIAFAIAAAFWFYHEIRTPMAGPLGMLRDTVMFSLVGALIQLIASWLIYSESKKQP